MTEERTPPFYIDENGKCVISGECFPVTSGTVVDLHIGNMTRDELTDLIDQRVKAALQAERDPRRRQ